MGGVQRGLVDISLTALLYSRWLVRSQAVIPLGKATTSDGMTMHSIKHFNVKAWFGDAVGALPIGGVCPNLGGVGR